MGEGIGNFSKILRISFSDMQDESSNVVANPRSKQFLSCSSFGDDTGLGSRQENDIFDRRSFFHYIRSVFRGFDDVDFVLFSVFGR